MKAAWLKGLAMSEADRQEILRLLQDGADALAKALEGIEESTAALRPRPGSWSVVECVEHLALSELALLSRLREATPGDSLHEDRAREAKFQDLAMNRARRIEAPEVVIPKIATTDLGQAVEGFHAARRETVRFVDQFPGDLHSWLTIHPLITRPVNCYEMLVLMAMHPRRHALQIAEARETGRRQARPE